MTLLKGITIGIMAASVVLWLAWDAFLGSKGLETESKLIEAAAHVSVAFPFVVGFWMGHLFANRSLVVTSSWVRGLPFFATLVIFDLVWYFVTKSQMTWFRYPALWLIAGIPIGSILWGQVL